MSSDKLPHHRRSIRLQSYDYSQNGAYFVTICTYERHNLLGQIREGEMILNEWGMIMQECWNAIPHHHRMAELDAFVVMPNHIHGILVIVRDEKTNHRNGTNVNKSDVERRGMIYHAPTISTPNNDQIKPKQSASASYRKFSKPVAGSLSNIIATFKAAVTRQINRLPDAPEHPVWQRNYHEHIIRNEKSLQTIREYVANSPARWAEDSLYVGE